jgi:glycosyltransferase involved in cell wall biosynthesis
LNHKSYKLTLRFYISYSKNLQNVSVIIPAFNEENAIGNVLADIPKHIVTEIVVVDNNSSDKTTENAKKGGATVLHEPKQGYGAACLLGIAYYKNKEIKPDIIVFLDADYSDYPEELEKIIEPILAKKADMVIGTRALGKREAGSMTIPQIFGNWLATRLIKLFYNVKFTDLGPFRAITWEALMALDMKDKTYGWTVEMQVKAAKMGLISVEVPVTYRNRIGVSKVSGTVKGTILAGYKILTTIFKYI